MEFDERVCQVALCLLPGIGPSTAKKLIEHYGTAGEIFRQKEQHLLKSRHAAAITAALKDDTVFHAAETELEEAAKKNIQTLFYLDAAFPSRLKQCYDCPPVLFYEGNAALNTKRIVGIVGTRRASAYGEMLTEKLVEGLAGENVLLVSGLAYGIDVIAHKAALKHNIPTVGVLAHGLDTLYPAAHRATARKMVSNGGLLSDFPTGTKPDKENFPKRNRIVAGLCDAIVVIESGASGGSMITAEYAGNYNRDVFAYPGRIGDELSAGCHKLIKNHKAALIESAEDLLKSMRWDSFKSTLSPQPDLPLGRDEDEEKILGLLRNQGNVHADALVIGSGMGESKVASVLLELEFSGIIKVLPGKFYRVN